jgi:hypothetical protein
MVMLSMPAGWLLEIQCMSDAWVVDVVTDPNLVVCL